MTLRPVFASTSCSSPSRSITRSNAITYLWFALCGPGASQRPSLLVCRFEAFRASLQGTEHLQDERRLATLAPPARESGAQLPAKDLEDALVLAEDLGAEALLTTFSSPVTVSRAMKSWISGAKCSASGYRLISTPISMGAL